MLVPGALSGCVDQGSGSPLSTADTSEISATNGIQAADEQNDAVAPSTSQPITTGTAALPANFVGPPLVEPALYGATWEGPIFSGLEPRPDIFESRDVLRWEGRQTLAGIWIAHPDAPPAARARFLNPRNGRAADGALIQRPAADEPLISSEAATILEIRPYRDTEIIIVAIDFPTIIAAAAEPAEPAESVVTDPEEGEEVATRQPEGSERDRAELSGVLSNTTPAPIRTGASASDDETDPGPSPDTTAPEPETVAVAATDPEENAFRWETDPATETAAAKPGSTRPLSARDQAAEETEISEKADLDAATPAPEESVLSVATATLEAAPAVLDQAAAAAAPTEAPAESPAPIIDDTSTASTATEPELELEPATAPDRDALRQRYLQAGVFGVEENARRVVAALSARGYEGRSIPVDLATGPAFRVRAGPFSTVQARNEAARLLRNLGIIDAVPVVR